MACQHLQLLVGGVGARSVWAPHFLLPFQSFSSIPLYHYYYYYRQLVELRLCPTTDTGNFPSLGQRPVQRPLRACHRLTHLRLLFSRFFAPGCFRLGLALAL
jgi:hypothetical protein